MTTVTAVRRTMGREPGSHLVDFTRTLGQNLINAQVFVQAKKSIENGIIADVISGCTHGLELYSQGSEIQLVETRSNGWVLRSNERH